MIHVNHAPTFEGWRHAARQLLSADVPPRETHWGDSLFAASVLPQGTGRHSIPRAFMWLAEAVACHRDPSRFALLYRLAFRLTHGEPALLEIETDEDVFAARKLMQSVRRDEHKMKAFVRFREAGKNHFIAWYRPDHLVLPLVAPFFAERFGSMTWLILTPDQSLGWNGESLAFLPGAPREAAPADDALEALWQDYYKAIFNPARLNEKLMQQHMPKKFWDLLPETRALASMLQPQARVQNMIERTTPAKRSALAFVGEDASLEGLQRAAATCQGCDLHARATQTVFGEGPRDARIMFVGEQPGDQEDQHGRVFIGPAGHVFDDALAAVGIERNSVYVTNAVKHFSWVEQGKKRIHQKPRAGEIRACQPWLVAEIEAVRPQIIVCLGATAAQAVIGQHVKITEQRGQWLPTPRAAACLVTYHPSAILRLEGEAKAEAHAAFIADLAAAAAKCQARGQHSRV